VSLDAILPASPTQSGQLALWQDSLAAGPRVNVRFSRKARRIAVRIATGGRVELVVPRGVSERRAWAFYESRLEWVQEHLARRMAAAPTEQEFPPRRLHLPLLGETWRLFRAGGKGRARVVEKGNVLALRGVGDQEAFRRSLLVWLKRRALAALAPRLTALAERHGFRFHRLRVGNQRSRWGSCSTRGLISLNLSLLFQSEGVVRYLLCHELAHTRHMDHSRDFWRCVAGCEPRWRTLDRALANGWRNVPAWIGGLP
jgi:predicted metal-dependent hydrolase